MRYSVFPPIRNGHFFWCTGIGRENAFDRGCFRCKFRAYLFAFFLSIGLAVWELYGSRQTQSLSLYSDAFHAAFDSLGYLIGLVALWHGEKTLHDEARFHESQSRLEVLMGVFIAIASLVILREAGRKLGVGAPEILETGLLFLIATAGLIGNVIVLFLFRSFEIGHEHHECKRFHDRDEILRANILHTFGDTVSSVLVVMNAVIFSFSNDPVWRYLDIIVSVFIASLLLWQAARMIAKNHERL